MKLLHISIHNFRGIIDASMNFQSYALLAGANNSGKSTIIDCIRAFYEKDGFKFKKESDFPFEGATDNESWVELEFSLNEKEYQSLKNDYKTSTKILKVKKHFNTQEKLSNGKDATGTIRAYTSDGQLSNESFYGAKNVQSGKFGDLVYIPAISKIDEHTKLTGPSALRDLVTSIMSDVVESSTAYQGLSDSVARFAHNVREMKTKDNRSLSNFENDLNTELASWETRFKLKFTTPSSAEIIKSMLGYEFQDTHHERPQTVEYFGSGFQRNFIYSLIQLRTKYTPQKAPKQSKDFTPSLNLVLFEEPEAFLHPPKQNDLARNLIRISKDENWQIVCSTHSSHFVSRNMNHIPAIIRTQRSNGMINTFQVEQETWNNIINKNQVINQCENLNIQKDDLKSEMEAIKYCLWLNPDRSSMFFSQNVLLVEGPSETGIINKLLDDERLSLPQGTYVLDCIGKFNIHRFMNLLNTLGITHSVLHDDDENRNENRNRHLELNQLIQASKGDFTCSISTIPQDLETMLSIPPVGKSYRKPQHLMYLYATNQINSQKLSDFCSKVQSCFSGCKDEKE